MAAQKFVVTDFNAYPELQSIMASLHSEYFYIQQELHRRGGEGGRGCPTQAHPALVRKQIILYKTGTKHMNVKHSPNSSFPKELQTNRRY